MMHKTDIMDMVARKLAPYMLLFGFYLVSYGDVSPGGGFQGGVVIASGLILLALARDVESAERLFSSKRLSGAEAAAYALLLGAGVTGLLLGAGFLGDFPGRGEEGRIVPAARFIFLLNLAIGVKVASGAGLICMALFRDEGGGARGGDWGAGGDSERGPGGISGGGTRGGSGGDSGEGPGGASEGGSEGLSQGGSEGDSQGGLEGGSERGPGRASGVDSGEGLKESSEGLSQGGAGGASEGVSKELSKGGAWASDVRRGDG